MINSMIVSLKENLKELYRGHSVTQRCANCAREVSDVRGKNLRKSRVSLCVSVCAKSTTC